MVVGWGVYSSIQAVMFRALCWGRDRKMDKIGASSSGESAAVQPDTEMGPKALDPHSPAASDKGRRPGYEEQRHGEQGPQAISWQVPLCS